MFFRNSFCIVCGNSILNDTAFKPKSYCDTNCRDYMKFKNALEKAIINIRCTSEARSIVRGDMFRLSNSVSNCTLTIRVN